MYIVMGATGHIGGAVARALLAAQQAVTVLTRDASKAASLHGAQVIELDVHDVGALRAAFARGRRAFLLNPPAPPSSDTDREERATVQAILSALDGSGLEAVVAQSTYGAQPGDRVGDLSVLYELEQGLARQAIPTTIVRGAYYYSNFDALLPAAREGHLPTMFPADLQLPMVAPADIGSIVARLLMKPSHGLVHVEGPARLDANQVAHAFAQALGRSVEPVVTPRAQWEQTFRTLGFSPEAASAFTRMTAATVERPELPREPLRGTTTLLSYLDALVSATRFSKGDA